jgi:DNA-binding NarL/FixJ family response regulator
LVVLLDGADAEDTVRVPTTGARAILDRSANRNEITAAIKAVASGLSVLPSDLLATLLHDAQLADVIARCLGISFHTAKFHVAAILAKLDADSRTEAVAKAEQLGLVVL